MSIRFLGCARDRHARGYVGSCAIAALLFVAGCGGGGGSTVYSTHGRLLSVTFPDPSNVNAESENTPPDAAPLLQQIVFTFDASPDPNRISAGTIQIRDANGFSVPGEFKADGPVVTFTPRLPTRPVVIAASGAVDTGGTGLLPGAPYTIRIGPSTLAFVSSVDFSLLSRYRDPSDRRGVIIGFHTTSDPAVFFSGPPVVAPQLVQSDPADGEAGVSPNLFTDPDHHFPARRSFFLRFDAPVTPDLANLGGDAFKLIDLDDGPGGLALGIDVAVVENDVAHSLIEVTPSGILPFGHQLTLEYPSDLLGIAQSGSLSGATSIAAAFTTASAPAGSVNDTLIEGFQSNDRQETDTSQLDNSAIAAEWNRDASHILQAGFAFQGDGLLGRFVPPAPPAGKINQIVLDTSSQPFPLFDGSTPDAPTYTILGGVFPFTDIDIPAGVVIAPLGNNPLVLTATGSVRIAGEIYVGGQDGNADNAYDSAVASIPGGASVCGGGRGGEGHPIIFYPPDQISFSNLVSPPYGGQGFGLDPVDGVMKRIGGSGGQCGMVDTPDSNGKYGTDHPADATYDYCNELRDFNPGVKVPGGGGGSMLNAGHRPGDADGGYGGHLRNGKGNVLPDGQGHFTVRDIVTGDVLTCGLPGALTFYDDGNSKNDFYGTRGQLQRLLGGQGGGSGASNVEAYYCGIWCFHDSDSSNDNVCNGYDFGLSGKYGDSVGDARGGGGGGGGGAVMLQALGPVTFESSAIIDAHGGRGLGGESIGCANFGGGGAGGAGGMVVVQSATSIDVLSGALFDVREGAGDRASAGDVYQSCDNGGAAGDGGPGGEGFIQLQVPAGQVANVVDPTGSFPRVRTKYDPSPWIDPTNTLNPVEFTPISVALSTWYDAGRMIARAPGSTPAFSFSGLDANGYVLTNTDGTLVDPATTDVVCEYLGQIDPITRQYKTGQEPRANFIPPTASVKVEFQGADAVAPGSKEVDPASTTPWTSSPTVADGMQFIRWRVTFDLTATGDSLSPDAPRPVVQRVQIHAQY